MDMSVEFHKKPRCSMVWDGTRFDFSELIENPKLVRTEVVWLMCSRARDSDLAQMKISSR